MNKKHRKQKQQKAAQKASESHPHIALMPATETDEHKRPKRAEEGDETASLHQVTPNGQTIRTIAREADVRQERALPEWNRCNQRLTETRV